VTISSDAKRYGILPLKKHGQNFIYDSSLCDKIVRASGVGESGNILEIGPGTAGLTRSILKTQPLLLTVVETDKRCIPLLEEIRTINPNLHIIQGDALEFSLEDLSHIKKIDIISNLPYHIGTELLIRWLKKIYLINSITVMLQKEVVDRMRAQPGIKEYSRLSVICQLICKVEKCFDVSNMAFYPPPKVQSSIVKLYPLPNPFSLSLVSKLELITRFAFGQRRKMIRSSLAALTPNIGILLQDLQINDSLRAEDLTPQEYLSLAKAINAY